MEVENGSLQYESSFFIYGFYGNSQFSMIPPGYGRKGKSSTWFHISRFVYLIFSATLSFLLYLHFGFSHATSLSEKMSDVTKMSRQHKSFSSFRLA